MHTVLEGADGSDHHRRHWLPAFRRPSEARIFDPFFTTKEVGRGTGQGLAIARSVVVDRHQGSLTFDSEVGKGTTFFIRFPLKPAERSQERSST